MVLVGFETYAAAYLVYFFRLKISCVFNTFYLFIFSDLLPGRRLNYVAADIGTNPPALGLSRGKSSLAAHAIRVMTEMRDNGTVAFIGPDDTCSSEALVAAAWNLPMISYVSYLHIH